MTQIDQFSKTQRAILILLKSEDQYGNEYSPVPGKTHLVKELFVICQKELGKKLLPELQFEPYDYGPYDETIYAEIDSLKETGYICFETATHNTKIQLTDKGKKVADQLWDKIKNDDIKMLFTYTKKNLNHLTAERLLDKIYSTHPDMTVNSISKVADKYRPKATR